MKLTKSRSKKKPVRIVLNPNAEIPLTVVLFNKYLNQIGFADFINDSVTWDQKQWRVSPGNLAKALVLSTFQKVRAPLSRIEDAFLGVDTEAILGKGILPEHLNDDAMAQTLDRISQAGSQKLYSSLALSLYSKFSISINRLHSDTTTVSFYGDYESDESTDAVQQDTSKKNLRIERGYNKDGRPECKQVVVGKIVNEHGIAVANSTMDGSTSDIEWNQKALELLKETFGDRLGNTIYIADSKLINLPTLKILQDKDHPIKFISRCPDNFYQKIASKMTEQAYQDNKWQDIGQISESKKASFYATREYTATVEGHQLRFIVVKTTEGKERADRELIHQRQLLEEGITDLKKKTFVCEADAEEEWKRFQHEFRKNIFQVHMELDKNEVAKRPRGNPGKNPKPPVMETTWKVLAAIDGPDPEKLKKLKQTKECFVLITNVSAVELDQEQILRQYKEQHVVETQFHLLKQPALASAIFLKTPERIDALVMLLNVSLLIRALIQYKLRKSIEESTEEIPKIGPNGSKLKNPTVNYLIEELGKTALIREAKDQYAYKLFDQKRALRVITYFKLLGVDMEDPL